MRKGYSYFSVFLTIIHYSKISHIFRRTTTNEIMNYLGNAENTRFKFFITVEDPKLNFLSSRGKNQEFIHSKLCNQFHSLALIFSDSTYDDDLLSFSFSLAARILQSLRIYHIRLYSQSFFIATVQLINFMALSTLCTVKNVSKYSY